jgi:hypothetical protein
VGNLTDTTGTGYGGYYIYPGEYDPDQGQAPKVLCTGKSLENNADIFAALMGLAEVEEKLGNAQDAAAWTVDVKVAGDFVMQMFDSATGHFFTGTMLVGSAPDPADGSCQTLFMSRGNDVINTCDFLDANISTTLALASAPHYRFMSDWRRPVRYVLDSFAQPGTGTGQTFSGFDIVPSRSADPNGVAWEFTGQAVETMRFADQIYRQPRLEVAVVASAPFGDGQGLVASTLQDGDTLGPLDQCLSTPFQRIDERVGLAATAWAIMPELRINPVRTKPIVANQTFSSTSDPLAVRILDSGGAHLSVSSTVISVAPTGGVRENSATSRQTDDAGGEASEPLKVDFGNSGSAHLSVSSTVISGRLVSPLEATVKGGRRAESALPSRKRN